MTFWRHAEDCPNAEGTRPTGCEHCEAVFAAEEFELTSCRRLSDEDLEAFTDGRHGFWLHDVASNGREQHFDGVYVHDDSYPRARLICFKDSGGWLPKFMKTKEEGVAEAFAKHHDGEVTH